MPNFLCFILVFITSILNGATQSPGPDENTAFRYVMVSGTNGDYVVSGEARLTAGKLYYSVEDGHVEYMNESEVCIKARDNGWVRFLIRIHISEGKLPSNGSLIMNLYERDRQDGMINPYPLILERFQ